MPFEFTCITDDPMGIDEDVRIIPLWRDLCDTKGCFRRLKIFSDDPEIRRMIGPRFASVDLDTVIVDDITPIFNRTEDFLVWGEHNRRNPFCGSLWIMDTGCRRQVWNNFDLADYPPDDSGKYPYGTDQRVMSDSLYPHEVMISKDEGIYNFNMDIKIWQHKHVIRTDTPKPEPPEPPKDPGSPRFRRKLKMQQYADRKARYERKKRRYHEKLEAWQARQEILQGKRKVMRRGGDGTLPDNARIIFFNGKHDPSEQELQRDYPWIAEHWR
jgi:hypothetical protein